MEFILRVLSDETVPCFLHPHPSPLCYRCKGASWRGESVGFEEICRIKQSRFGRRPRSIDDRSLFLDVTVDVRTYARTEVTSAIVIGL